MALSLDSLGGLVQKGFARAALSTSAGLRNDELVRSAARNIYDFIPFPANIAIKMSVGIEGLERFALAFRDVLLAAGIADLSKLGPDEMRALLRKSLAAVPGLGRVLATTGSGDPAATAAAAAPVGVVPLAQVLGADAHRVAAEPLPAKSWYLMRGATRYGPWSDPEFLSIAEAGRLDGGDRVWRDGFPGWVEVRALPGLVGDDGTGSRH